MIVVLDVNVLIAAQATRGLCFDVVAVCVERHEIVMCEEMLAEMRRVLARKLGAPRDVLDRVEEIFRQRARLVVPAPVSRNACRDPDDLHVLGAARAGGAELIVTGDDDLLVLKRFDAARVLSPREFWEEFRSAT